MLLSLVPVIGADSAFLPTLRIVCEQRVEASILRLPALCLPQAAQLIAISHLHCLHDDYQTHKYTLALTSCMLTKLGLEFRSLFCAIHPLNCFIITAARYGAMFEQTFVAPHCVCL